MELVFDVSPSGRVEGMYHDALNLKFLGNQEVKRASDIRFDTDTQTWGIWFVTEDGQQVEPYINEFRGFIGYEQARAFEVQYLNLMRLDGYKLFNGGKYSAPAMVSAKYLRGLQHLFMR